ncbi:UFD1-domain-containing protein [Exidia glandulosa HHB12029]|uniref:UFD1-domain-containing protein n=1 Tax=Exidia glandulosa HHB12029 TaxID=1314781 RepID=A0A165DE38_EXIGL|nr:UFD1-domain-containing protein [Exidia glandulosa HHB12029]
MFGGNYNNNGGLGGLLGQFAGGFGGGLGPGHGGRGAPPQAYDAYFKAYSMAMLTDRRERANVSYGGKIILPPSALAQLTSLDIESPWFFALKNPANPAASTHAGVLEFIAEEGVAHLPYWMMKTLRLNEGDAIHIKGATLPKGKRVKLQPQTKDFIELADPKAVLEKELRNFSTLSQGDIIEIQHNTITFALLIMEILPPGPGIVIIDTDLEVDFAAPKDYVEPARPAPAPVPTMASRLKIDLNASTPGSSRPASAMGGVATGGGPQATGWEHFKGRGETLAGRKTKGKGVSAKNVEEVAEGSKINRTDRARIVHTDDLERPDSAPAPLVLPFGQLFFGYNYVPYKPPASAAPGSLPPAPSAFGGQGATLQGGASSSKGKGKENKPAAAPPESTPSASHSWGKGGHTLTGLSATAAALAPKLPNRSASGSAEATTHKRDKSPEIDWDYYDDSMDQDDDVIEIDSD